MAITIRSVKGSALTHTEMDTNFRSFYYSSSVTPSELVLYTTASGDTGTVLSFNNAVGDNYHIQFKSGSGASGSLCRFSSSANLLFDYDQNHLKVTGSGYITGDLTVGGSVQAQTFHTEYVTSSIIYESGSQRWGDSTDDTHTFTGSLKILGPVTQSGDMTRTGNYLAVGTYESTGSFALSGSMTHSGSYTRQGDHESTGSLKNKGAITNVGVLTNTGNVNITGLSTFTGGIIGSADISGSTFNNTGAVGSSHLTGSFTGSFTGKNDGLTNLPVQTYTNGTDNRVVTSTGTDSINGEANLTFNGTSLNLTGAFTSSGIISSSYLGGHTLYALNVRRSSIGGGGEGNPDLYGQNNILAIGHSADTSGFIHTNTGIRLTANTQITGSVSASGAISGSIAYFPNTSLSSATAYKTVMINTTDGRLYYTGSYGGGGGGGGATVYTPAPYRVVTAGAASSSLSGSTDLTWDGENLKFNNDTIISDISASSAHTDVKGLLSGNDIHTLVEGKTTGHVVVGLRGANTSSKFAVISGKGDYYSNTTYDHTAFSVDSSGSFVFNGTGQITGSLQVKGDVTAFYSSDERLKDNVTPILNPVDKVKSIGGYEFDWNDKSDKKGHDVGVIAQEIEKVLPELVVERDSGYKAVRYEKIVALLIEAIKQQQLQIDELKSKV